MPMQRALEIVIGCTWLAVASLLIALVYAALFGRLSLKGLLIDKQTRLFSVARLQLVGSALVVSFIYLKTVADSPPAKELPELDGTLLAAALSGGFYGLAKLNSALKASSHVSLFEAIAGSPRRN